MTERQAGSGELARYGAVIAPGTARVSDALVDQIDAYVHHGGALIFIETTEESAGTK